MKEKTAELIAAAYNVLHTAMCSDDWVIPMQQCDDDGEPVGPLDALGVLEKALEGMETTCSEDCNCKPVDSFDIAGQEILKLSEAINLETEEYAEKMGYTQDAVLWHQGAQHAMEKVLKIMNNPIAASRESQAGRRRDVLMESLQKGTEELCRKVYGTSDSKIQAELDRKNDRIEELEIEVHALTYKLEGPGEDL